MEANSVKIYNAYDIIWDGPNIPCITLCKGDVVSDVIYKLGKQICKIVNDNCVLETLDLSCLIGYCTNCNENFTLKYLLQLILNNDCSIHELINQLEQSLLDKLEIILSLDFSCINDSNLCEINIPFDTCGKLTTQDLNLVFQYFIDQICCQSEILENIISSYNESQSYYEFINDNISYYTEPKFTTCLNPVLLKHSLNTNINASNVCSLINNIGIDIDLSNQIIDCPNSGDELNEATNLAQSTYNQWLVLEDINNWLLSIEDRVCCKPKCSDIVITPYISYNQSTYTLTLNFSTLFGNSIPTGWIDNGSYIEVVDSLSGVILNSTPIYNNTIISINVQSLNLNNPLTIKIHSLYKQGELNCQSVKTEIYTTPATPESPTPTVTFPQTEPTSIWVINHNLGHNPSVITVDSSGNIITGTITNLNVNLLTIDFGTTYSGTAYLT